MSKPEANSRSNEKQNLADLHGCEYVNRFEIQQSPFRLERLISLMGLSGEMTVCDSGSGNGMLMEHVCPLVSRYVGIDPKRCNIRVDKSGRTGSLKLTAGSPMTPDSFSALDAAGWPVLLVDRAGVIHRANTAATKAFDPFLDSLPVPLAKVWPAQTVVSPEAWLTQWDPTAALLRSLRLKGAGNKILLFSAAVSRVNPPEAGQYLIQLLPDSR